MIKFPHKRSFRAVEVQWQLHALYQLVNDTDQISLESSVMGGEGKSVFFVSFFCLKLSIIYKISAYFTVMTLSLGLNYKIYNLTMFQQFQP